jgi:2-polyprenyl-6-methoxyphenol hydroxylase-like FAD-dependent oxidoreductase
MEGDHHKSSRWIGIGGMAAALGCGLAGHEVLVLEDAPEVCHFHFPPHVPRLKCSQIGEVGAGLQVAPNMMRILERTSPAIRRQIHH